MNRSGYSKPTTLHDAKCFSNSCIPTKRAYALGFLDGIEGRDPDVSKLESGLFNGPLVEDYEEGWLNGWYKRK